jgi:hypothetical protein
MKGRYGWDKLENEGLKELERIASSKFLAGKDDLIDLIQRYIKLYKNNRIVRKKEISASILYFDLVEKKALEKFREIEREKALADLQIKSPKSQPRRNVSDEEATKLYLKLSAENKMLRKEIEKPAQDKATKHIREIRKELQNFYNLDEGKESGYRIYFVADERDYRIGIEKVDVLNEIRKEATTTPADSSIIRTNIKFPYSERIKGILLDFFKIYPDVWKAFPCSGVMQWIMKIKIIQWAINVTRLRHRCELDQQLFVGIFKQDAVINRVKDSNYFKASAFGIVALILSLGIVVLLFHDFMNRIDILPVSPSIALWQDLLMNWLKKKVMYILWPGSIIIFLFVFINSCVLFGIYRLFGGKASCKETLNLNLYYFSSWNPFVALGALLHGLPTIKINLALSWVLLFILIYAIFSYLSTLFKLMAVSWKRGVPAFILFIFIHFIFIRLIF